jgi:hypothetical protein
VLLDEHALEEVDFTMDMAGLLGDFATTNQYSVRNLKEKLKKKDMLVNQLKNQIKTLEQNVRSEMKKGFEKIEPMTDNKFSRSNSVLTKCIIMQRKVENGPFSRESW